jgi:hypothetical protein
LTAPRILCTSKQPSADLETCVNFKARLNVIKRKIRARKGKFWLIPKDVAMKEEK